MSVPSLDTSDKVYCEICCELLDEGQYQVEFVEGRKVHLDCAADAWEPMDWLSE